MSTGVALVGTYIGAAILIYLIGNSFKDFDLLSFLGREQENDNLTQWYNLGFRMIFYTIALGFVGEAVGSLQDIVNADSNFNSNKVNINNTITSAVVLLVRTQTFTYVILGILMLLLILLTIFSKLKKAGDDMTRDYDSFGK